MPATSTLPIGSNANAYCSTWLTDKNIKALLLNEKYPPALKSRETAYGFVGRTWQSDLRVLAYFQVAEILAEMNRDFCVGRGTIRYIFGTTQSGFVLETSNFSLPEIFMGLVKDPDLFNAGQEASLGLGLGYSLKQQGQPTDYLEVARQGGLISPADKSARELFAALLLQFVRNVVAVRAFASPVRVQGLHGALSPTAQSGQNESGWLL
jgi:hypothetical protein